MNLPPTNELLARYSKFGDEAAFRELVERYAGLVGAAAARRLGARRHLTQDVTQAVFVSLAQRAKFLPHDVVLPAWLHTVAVRRALNIIRSETRRERREAVSVASTTPSSLENVPLWQSLSPEIDEAIACLSKRDRDAIGARFLDGNDIAGTATALGISHEAAKKRVARALERLRVRLDRRGIIAATSAIGVCLAAPEMQAGTSIVTQPISAAALASEPGSFATAAMSVSAHPGSVLLGVASAFVLSIAIAQQPAPGEPSTAPQVGRAQRLSAIHPKPQPAADSSLIVDATELEVEDLIARLELLANSPRTAVNKAKLNNLIATIPIDVLAPLMDLADAQLSLPAKYRLMRPLVDLFAKHDPAAAMDYLIAHNIDLQLQDQGSGISGYAFKKWWKRDRAASADWLAKNIAEPNFNHVLSNNGTIWISPVRELAAEDPGAALEFVNLLPPSRLTRGMRAQLAPQSYHNAWGSQEWKGFTDQVAAAANSTEFLRGVASSWAEVDDDGVVEWIAASSEIDAKLTVALGRLAADSKYEVTRTPNGGISRRSIGIKDRPERASLVLEQATSLPLDEALVKIGEAWPQSEEARGWLLERGPDGVADTALAALARQWPEDRALPMRIAEGIHDPELRRRTLAGAYLRWQRQSPGEAASWLSSTAIPPADLVILKEVQLP